eukprot:Selendium_serpulae@DN6311_c1_g1_i2.p1
MSFVCTQIVMEPVVREAEDDQPGLVADLKMRGLDTPQTDTLVDIRFTDTDTQPRLNKAVATVLKSSEGEKNRQFLDACRDRRAHFHPFVVSPDGALGKSATKVLNLLCDRLCDKWTSNRSETMGWLRTRISFAILRATNG